MDKIGNITFIHALESHLVFLGVVDCSSELKYGDELTQDKQEDALQLCLTVQYLMPLQMPVAINAGRNVVHGQPVPVDEFTFKHHETSSCDNNVSQRPQGNILSRSMHSQSLTQTITSPLSTPQSSTVSGNTGAVFGASESEFRENEEAVKNRSQHFPDGISKTSRRFPVGIDRLNKYFLEGIDRMSQHFPQAINSTSIPEGIDNTSNQLPKKVESESPHLLNGDTAVHHRFKSEQKVVLVTPKVTISENGHRDNKKPEVTIGNAELAQPLNMEAKDKENRIVFDSKNATNEGRTPPRRRFISPLIQNTPSATIKVEGEKPIHSDIVYRFKSWGDEHAVHISRQPNQRISQVLLQPTSDLVEQRLHDHVSNREGTWVVRSRQDEKGRGRHRLWLDGDEEL